MNHNFLKKIPKNKNSEQSSVIQVLSCTVYSVYSEFFQRFYYWQSNEINEELTSRTWRLVHLNCLRHHINFIKILQQQPFNSLVLTWAFPEGRICPTVPRWPGFVSNGLFSTLIAPAGWIGVFHSSVLKISKYKIYLVEFPLCSKLFQQSLDDVSNTTALLFESAEKTTVYSLLIL